MKSTLAIENLVDCTRYPLHDLHGEAARALVAECRAKWMAHGNLDLPGFVRSDVLEQMAIEVADLPGAFNHTDGTTYPRARRPARLKSDSAVAALPSSHPLRRSTKQDTLVIAADQIPARSLISELYASQQLTDFIAAVVDKNPWTTTMDATKTDATKVTPVHRMADEFQCLNIVYMDAGHARAYHYDGTDAVMTLLLQKAEKGGEFECAPCVRNPVGLDEGGDDEMERVRAVLDDEVATTVSSADAGTFNIFNGRRSLHRVREVSGDTRRVIAVFSYDSAPDVHATREKNIELFGNRVEKIYAEREKVEAGHAAAKVSKL